MNSDPQIKPSTNEPLAALVGLDWADEKHAVALQAANSQSKEHTTLEHTPEALSDWVAQLHQRFPGGQIAIILEQSRGALLYALLPHDHLHSRRAAVLALLALISMCCSLRLTSRQSSL